MDTLSRRELFKKYSYDLVNTDDLEELQNLFNYASGVIIKNADLAEQYETSVSARNSNTYLKACLKQDDYNETQREKLKQMYKETNKYYNWLYTEYKIDPLYARLAEDYEIIKSINLTSDNGTTLLNKWQEELFHKCYKESLFYWNNVTRTKSFKNETMFRDFSEVYLLFMTIQRYITNRMKNQFDVDTFNKFQCKNYFISNGVDYFDNLPIIYQRRLIKLLNDLQRDKGDDTVFNYIKDILMIKDLDIYKYVLVKTNPTTDMPKGDLYFYKVPYDEELNTDTNDRFTFEEITEDDPYWRSSKDEVLYQTFNTVDTKYISVEHVINMIKNGKSLSYFMYLLNDSMLDNIKNNKKSSLRFFNKNISANPIRLYDAIMTLYSLFYTYIRNDHFEDEENPADKIDQDGDGVIGGPSLITNIYGYKEYANSEEVTNLIKKLEDEIDIENAKSTTPEATITWNNNLRYFLSTFKLRDFYYSDNFVFETIEDYYFNPRYIENTGGVITTVKMGKDTIKSEFLELARYIKAVGYYDVTNKELNSAELANKAFDIYKNVLNDNLKPSLDYIYNLVITGSMPLECIGIHSNFKKLFKKFIAYKIINGEITTNDEIGRKPPYNKYYNNRYDLFYNFMIMDSPYPHKENPIFAELKKYCNRMYDTDMAYYVKFIENYDTEVGFANFIKFINIVQNSFFTNDQLMEYPNLYTFLDVFASLKKEIYTKNAQADQTLSGMVDSISMYSDLKIDEFMQILNKNESIRTELETFIKEATNRDIYNDLRALWTLKFKSDFNMSIYQEFESFKQYLMDKDEELYRYATEFGTFDKDTDRRKEIENRILEISTSIESFIQSQNDIIYNSTFNVIFSNIKDYAHLLIKVFKSYTLDTIYASNILDFSDDLNDRIKLFDDVEGIDEIRNTDSVVFEDLTFDTQSEYIDLQDDIRKDNGDLDISYSLTTRSMIVSDYTSADTIDGNEPFHFMNFDTIFYQSQEKNLPYAFTSLTPKEFEESEYIHEVIKGKLGLDSNVKLNYVLNSYTLYDTEYDGETDTRPIYDYKKIKKFRIKDFLGIESHDKEYLTALLIDSYPEEVIHERILINTTNHMMYCDIKDSAYTLYWSANPNSDGYYEFDYLAALSDPSDPLDPDKVAYLRSEDSEVYLMTWNETYNTFIEKLKLPSLVCYNGLKPKYVNNYELEDGKFNVYYDPYVCYGIIDWDGVYCLDPIGTLYKDNSYYQKEDPVTHEIVYDKLDEINYILNTSNNSKFYLRKSTDYLYKIEDRLPYNKKVSPQIVSIPSKEYVEFLNENKFVRKEYVYKLYDTEDEINKYFVPVLNEDIPDEEVYKIDLNQYKDESQFNDLKSFSINGNYNDGSVELELGHNYSVTVQFKFSDFIAAYEKMLDPTVVFKPFTLYYNSSSSEDITEEELSKYANVLSYSKSGSNYTLTLDSSKGRDRRKSTVLLDVDTNTGIDKKDSILEFFDKVGCPANGAKGYSSSSPFTNINELLDEIKKYHIHFLLPCSTPDSHKVDIYKYDRNISGNLYKIGCSYNNRQARFYLLYEPMRYYNNKSFEGLLIEDQTRQEDVPYYVDIDPSVTDGIPPKPVLKPSDSTTDYLTALHPEYVTDQLSRYYIYLSSSGVVIAYSELHSYFKSLEYKGRVVDSGTGLTMDQYYNTVTSTTFNHPTNLYDYAGDYINIYDSGFDSNAEKQTIKIPSTINNNAHLLTLYLDATEPS